MTDCPDMTDMAAETLIIIADPDDPSRGWARMGTSRWRCALGRSGVADNKSEGDGMTPAGEYPLRRLLYRSDRLALPRTGLRGRPIGPNDGWCDDPLSPVYNKWVRLPNEWRCEKLWRDDHLYDLVVPIGYNDDPTLPDLGSAIFLHLARPDYAPTEGCIAFSRADLLEILRRCGRGTRLRIEPPPNRMRDSHMAPTDTHQELPPEQIGAAVWYGPEMARRTDWIEILSPNDIAEIESAATYAAGRRQNIAEIAREDFPLPTLGPRLQRILGDVIDGRGFALLRGLPVERLTLRQAATAYFGLGTWFGNARSQNARGHVLGHVKDMGLSSSDPNVRIYQTNERQTYHTDSCDIVGLLCLKTARSGGLSTLVSSSTIFNEMRRRRPDLLRLLLQPVATDRRGEVPAGMKPWFEIPVFNWHAGKLSAIYQRQYIDSAQRFDQAPRLTERQIEALDLFDDLANDPHLNLHMEFRPGDIQLVHNHVLLHDRTGFEDWPEPERRRHLLRLWLAAPGARELPPVYAQRYGSIAIGDRGGIILPGTIALHAPLEAE